jgi:hypothetical protein
LRNLAQRRPVSLQRQDDGQQVGRAFVRLRRLGGVALGAAVDLVAQVGRIAQRDAAGLGRR